MFFGLGVLLTSEGSFPDLLAATTEELTSGLESRGFTSVDLVNVGSSYCKEYSQ